MKDTLLSHHYVNTMAQCPRDGHPFLPTGPLSQTLVTPEMPVTKIYKAISVCVS